MPAGWDSTGITSPSTTCAALAGLALERRDLDSAEQLTEQVLRISERRWPLPEFLALLDRARIWAARGEVREALATIESARRSLPVQAPRCRPGPMSLRQLLRLSLGDLRTPAELAEQAHPGSRR